MSGQHLDHVARAPLFDRLIDLDRRMPRERRPFRTLTPGELLDSVRREVDTLLNTRCPLTLEALLDRERTVIDYGAPDLSWAGPLSGEDQRRLGVLLSQTISAYEPRLCQVQVSIGAYDQVKHCVHLNVTAALIIDEQGETFSFPIALKASVGSAGHDGL